MLTTFVGTQAFYLVHVFLLVSARMVNLMAVTLIVLAGFISIKSRCCRYKLEQDVVATRDLAARLESNKDSVQRRCAAKELECERAVETIQDLEREIATLKDRNAMYVHIDCVLTLSSFTLTSLSSVLSTFKPNPVHTSKPP